MSLLYCNLASEMNESLANNYYICMLENFNKIISSDMEMQLTGFAYYKLEISPV